MPEYGHFIGGVLHGIRSSLGDEAPATWDRHVFAPGFETKPESIDRYRREGQLSDGTYIYFIADWTSVR